MLFSSLLCFLSGKSANQRSLFAPAPPRPGSSIVRPATALPLSLEGSRRLKPDLADKMGRTLFFPPARSSPIIKPKILAIFPKLSQAISISTAPPFPVRTKQPASATAASPPPSPHGRPVPLLPHGGFSRRLPPRAGRERAGCGPPVAAPDPDKEVGFQRPELGKEKLAGTVGFHERHVFLCFKGPEEWPSHVEATQSDSLPGLLAAALEARKPNLKMSTKLTICEGEDGTESTLGDVLIFPDMIRYRGLTHSDVDNFVEEVLVKDIEWGPGSPEAIKGSYVFVCCHGSRDKRCGVCGPALIKRFKEEIEGQGLVGQVAVSACSHVGGHKYAGNVIIFSSDAKGEVIGHWYGKVAPDDVPVLLNKHIGQGEIVDHLWRPMDLYWLDLEEKLAWGKGKQARGKGKHARSKGKHARGNDKHARGNGKHTRGNGKHARGNGKGLDAPTEIPDFLFNTPELPVLVPALTRRKVKNRKYRKNAAVARSALKDMAGIVIVVKDPRSK